MYIFTLLNKKYMLQSMLQLNNNYQLENLVVVSLMKIDREKCKKLAIGVIGIYTLYFLGSIIQQRIMKIPYGSSQTGDIQHFESSNAFILIPSFISWILGFFYSKFTSQNKQLAVPRLKWIESSAVILVGALAMTKAIYLTSFPLVTLFKSCNLLSVLTVGIFFSRVVEKSQKLQKKKLLIGFFITLGILLYQFGKGTEGQQYSGNIFGITLLIISVICDGLLPDFQAQIKSKYSPTPMQMFENINKWKTCLCLIYSLFNFELVYLYHFFAAHPLCLLHMLALSLTGSIGQMFIYWMINHFRQHVVPFVVTTRKLLTVGISILYFHHQVTKVQVLGIILVFIIICYDFLDELKVQIIPVATTPASITMQSKEEGNQLLKFSQKIEQKIQQKIQVENQCDSSQEYMMQKKTQTI